MLKPDEVCSLKALWQRRWGIKRIARELGYSKNTVRRYARAFEQGLNGPEPGATPPGRPRELASVAAGWLKDQLVRHGGNADVVRQELRREFGLTPSLRTVERAVAPFRQELRAEALATLRFETPPGRQLQVDFGTRRVKIAGVEIKVHLCVLTLGYSRRIYVQAFRSERQAAWLTAIEGAFRHFGGVAAEILVDNAKALVEHNDGHGHVVFNAGFRAFCDYWGIRPKACRPYRARTKGKDERAVQYVKRNALAGHSFASWSDLEAHLAWWMREIADKHVHQTTRQAPIERFETEKGALTPIGDHKPYAAQRSWRRVVKSDATVDVRASSYSVPYRLIGKTVDVTAEGGCIEVRLAGELIAVHAEAGEAGTRVITPEHLAGVLRIGANWRDEALPETAASVVGDSALLRPLSEYEALFDGSAALAGGAP